MILSASRMRLPVTGVLALVAVAMAGCGGDYLRLSFPDGTLVERGASIQVVAEAREQGNAPPDGSTVTFHTTVGSFEQFGNQVMQAVNTAEASTTRGRAVATLYSFPGEGGAGTVSASYLTINSITVSDEASVTLTGGGKVSGARLTANCDPLNVSAFADAQERNEMQVRCMVWAKDIRGNPIPKARVHAMVESGCGVVQMDNPDSMAFVFSLSPACDPQDVDPMSGEPSHMEQGVVHNPRDGLLTVVFYTDGEEGYVDANGNGQYDAGESFAGYDLAEPYVDVDDNNEFDPGEPYLDVNEDQEWSTADGHWNGETSVWVATHLMLTGRPHESSDTTRASPSGITIENAGDQTLTLYLMDINHNPIATHQDNDRIEFSVDGADLLSSSRVALIKSMGLKFTDEGTIIGSSFDQDRIYQVTIEDEQPTQVEPGSVVLRTSIEWTPAPGFGLYSPTRLSADLTEVTGTSD